MSEKIAIKRLWDWVGLVVRTKVDMRNGTASVPAGSLGLVIHQRGGAEVQFESCECCGVAVRMSKINLSHLDPIERAFEPPSYGCSLYVSATKLTEFWHMRRHRG